jgi:pSer/pThr/pTyr-binding forkhead associated (FHA) protein
VVLGDATPRLLALREPARRWVVGRGRASDVVVRDPDMSREHFEVTYESGRYRVRDLGSKNGLFVNGLPVDVGVLQAGDEVVAGATVLRFES